MVGKDKDFMEPKFVVEINSYLDVIQRAYQAGEFPPEPEQLQRKNVQKDMIIGILCALIVHFSVILGQNQINPRLCRGREEIFR